MGVIDDRKVILGIIELLLVRVYIDLVACYFVVGSPYFGGVVVVKGGVVCLLKGIVSWV